MKKFLIVLIILIVIGVGAVAFLPGYLSKTSNSEPVTVEVPSGANLSTVAEDLYDKGVIRSKLWFRYKGREISKNIKPGTYEIDTGLALEDIFEIIQQGEQEEQVTITFPEGFILYQFAERIEEAGLGTKEEFIEATNRYFESKGYDFDTTDIYFNMEGYLFPDTYKFGVNQSMDEIVAKLAGTMEAVFTDEYKARADELGLSMHEVLTLASLIEREAYNDEERAAVSGVIHNRLDIDMILQIDATVIYGIGEGKEHKTQVLLDDLKVDNPYNTYMYKGLPPGPIACPGAKSIEAVLYPESHNYFYYVLGDNGHVFSKTFEEHQANIRKYR